MNTVIATTGEGDENKPCSITKGLSCIIFFICVVSGWSQCPPEVRVAVLWSATVLSTKWNKTYGDRGDELGENLIVICYFVSNKLVCIWLVGEVEE